MRCFLTIGVLFAMSWISPGEDVIDSLVKEVQGKKPDEVRALIVGRLGEPTRDIGSGISIDQWDVAGGELTFHPGSGPTFRKDGKTRWLIRTTNPAASCLFGGYQMTTIPDPKNHGNCFWLGVVSITSDGKYQYTDGGSNQKQRSGQNENFFILHPKGTVRVEYEKGVTAETRLEDRPEGSRLATLTFSTPGEAVDKVYEIMADVTDRQLSFKGPKSPFKMDRGWVNFWK